MVVCQIQVKLRNGLRRSLSRLLKLLDMELLSMVPICDLFIFIYIESLHYAFLLYILFAKCGTLVFATVLNFNSEDTSNLITLIQRHNLVNNSTYVEEQAIILLAD